MGHICVEILQFVMKHDISYHKCHAIKTMFDVGPSNISHIKEGLYALLLKFSCKRKIL